MIKVNHVGKTSTIIDINNTSNLSFDVTFSYDNSVTLKLKRSEDAIWIQISGIDNSNMEMFHNIGIDHDMQFNIDTQLSSEKIDSYPISQNESIKSETRIMNVLNKCKECGCDNTLNDKILCALCDNKLRSMQKCVQCRECGIILNEWNRVFHRPVCKKCNVMTKK